jgi:hypothetical protein
MHNEIRNAQEYDVWGFNFDEVDLLSSLGDLGTTDEFEGLSYSFEPLESVPQYLDKNDELKESSSQPNEATTIQVAQIPGGDLRVDTPVIDYKDPINSIPAVLDTAKKPEYLTYSFEPLDSVQGLGKTDESKESSSASNDANKNQLAQIREET